jgi:hypothetical protein
MKKTIKCGTWVSRKFVPEIAFVSGSKSRLHAVWRFEPVKSACKTPVKTQTPSIKMFGRFRND